MGKGVWFFLLLYLIFVYNVMRAVKVRTGEEDYEAIQDVE